MMNVKMFIMAFKLIFLFIINKEIVLTNTQFPPHFELGQLGFYNIQFKKRVSITGTNWLNIDTCTFSDDFEFYINHREYINGFVRELEYIRCGSALPLSPFSNLGWVFLGGVFLINMMSDWQESIEKHWGIWTQYKLGFDFKLSATSLNWCGKGT